MESDLKRVTKSTRVGGICLCESNLTNCYPTDKEFAHYSIRKWKFHFETLIFGSFTKINTGVFQRYLAIPSIKTNSRCEKQWPTCKTTSRNIFCQPSQCQPRIFSPSYLRFKVYRAEHLFRLPRKIVRDDKRVYFKREVNWKKTFVRDTVVS